MCALYAWVRLCVGACAHGCLGTVRCMLGCVSAWVRVPMGAWVLCAVCLGACPRGWVCMCVHVCAVYACVLL